MKGLELCEAYYTEFGAPMLREQFPELEHTAAAGLVGAGSECFGYDDEISQDHDFEPGFCLFLPDGTAADSREEFRLERAYAKLPEEFRGFRRPKLSPMGGNRRGVMRTGDFYSARIGRRDGFSSLKEWFSVPEFYLAEATNGKVFRDDEGSFTAIRNSLLQMPDDVRNKKLAGQLVLMEQSGQYNYARCISHGETGAAQLAAGEFAAAAMAAAFLLCRKWMPYYKWRFRALRDLPDFSGLAPVLEALLTLPNDAESVRKKEGLIAETSAAIIASLRAQGLSSAGGDRLDRHAISVNDRVADPWLRNAGILYGV